jgi:hypothetical protein
MKVMSLNPPYAHLHLTQLLTENHSLVIGSSTTGVLGYYKGNSKMENPWFSVDVLKALFSFMTCKLNFYRPRLLAPHSCKTPAEHPAPQMTDKEKARLTLLWNAYASFMALCT